MELNTEIKAEIKRETDPIYEKVSKVIPEIEWAFHAPLIHKINMLKKEKIKLFGLVEFLADKDISFAKKIAKKIKDKALKKLAHSIIEDFEFSYQLEDMKHNGVQIIQL